MTHIDLHPIRRVTRAVGLLATSTALLAVAPATAAQKFEATITRTGFGMPHIKARNFRGLGYGAAYAQAQDNICLMADGYVSAAGERSKYFGARGAAVIGLFPGTNLDNDVFYATMADTALLRAEFAKASSDYKALVDGWIAGYNRFLRDHQTALPKECAGQAWVRPINRDDVLRVTNGFTMLSGSAGLATFISTAAPPGTTGAPPTPAHAVLDLPAEIALGSNGWAFGGDATTNGRGLVVGNPHFPWMGPNRFYQMHLTIPGKVDVAGAGIMNQPYVGIGFNKDVAWTHTVDTAAHMTLFKVTLDPADPTAYLVDGKREAMTRRQITIADKDGAPIIRTLYSTRYGPIASLPNTPYAWTEQSAYAVADANRGNIRSGDGYLAMSRARNVRDIRAALARHLAAPFINTIAADRSGEALYADIAPAANVSAERFASCGTISPPIPGQLQRFYLLDGSRADCAWEKTAGTPVPGLLHPDKMATIYRRDFVQNSNDSYRWTNPAAGILELGPMMGTDPQPSISFRTRSGLQEIGRVLASGKFDIDLAAQTMFGNKNFAAPLVLPPLLKLCEGKGDLKEACATLAGWDGQMDNDRRGAMLFMLFWSRAMKLPDMWAVPFDRSDIVNTPRDLRTDGAKGEALLAALTGAVEMMKQLDLAIDAPLGDSLFVERGDERIPISGSFTGDTLNYTAGLPAKGGFRVIHGASWVQSVTFDDTGPVAKGVLTYSQSTNPESPHYADQTREWSKLKLHSIPFTDAQIAADAISAPVTIRE